MAKMKAAAYAAAFILQCQRVEYEVFVFRRRVGDGV